jgi:hypothetical protein
MPVKLMIAVFALNIVGATIAIAGPCDHASDRAKDGSRCGDRAADRRPGGR